MIKLTVAAAVAAMFMGQATAPGAGVADLGWMVGRWETSGTQITEESWANARGGVMLGFSRTLRGDTLREWEFLRLQAGEDGTTTYFAQPGGRAPTPFRLVRVEGTSATFENPAHDYPQRIRYERTGDRMTATISTIEGGNPLTFSYRLQH